MLRSMSRQSFEGLWQGGWKIWRNLWDGPKKRSNPRSLNAAHYACRDASMAKHCKFSLQHVVFTSLLVRGQKVPSEQLLSCWDSVATSEHVCCCQLLIVRHTQDYKFLAKGSLTVGNGEACTVLPSNIRARTSLDRRPVVILPDRPVWTCKT